MKKLLTILIVISILALGLSLSPIFAKNAKNPGDQDIPEQDGIYDVPGHPEMKVRVFVHRVKPDKPGKPAPPTPELVCYLDDPQSSAVVDKEVWHLPNAWTYNLNLDSVPSSVGGNKLPTIASNSFKVWTDQVNVIIAKGDNTAVSQKGLDGINVITWGRTSGTALAVTYIWYFPSTGLVAELDTIMNKKFFWMWSDGSSTCAYADSYDAQDILTHELGHWFGLDDEYADDYANNTMYGYGSKAEVKKNTLTTGDINGVKAIY